MTGCIFCVLASSKSQINSFIHILCLYFTHSRILFLSYFLPVLLLSLSQAQKQTKHKNWNDVELSLETTAITLPEGPQSRMWPSKLRPEALPPFTLATMVPLSIFLFHKDGREGFKWNQ